MPKVLIIGYGNSMRGDDVVGCHVARMLEERYRDEPDVRVLGAPQLTPEMTEDVAASEFVLFLDAAVGTHAGDIRQEKLKSRSGPLSLAHSLDPDLLLAAADKLYGSVPRAELLTIVGASFEVGDRLSTPVTRRLPGFLKRAQAIVESHRRCTTRELVP